MQSTCKFPAQTNLYLSLLIILIKLFSFLGLSKNFGKKLEWFLYFSDFSVTGKFDPNVEAS